MRQRKVNLAMTHSHNQPTGKQSQPVLTHVVRVDPHPRGDINRRFRVCWTSTVSAGEPGAAIGRDVFGIEFPIDLADGTLRPPMICRSSSTEKDCGDIRHRGDSSEYGDPEHHSRQPHRLLRQVNSLSSETLPEFGLDRLDGESRMSEAPGHSRLDQQIYVLGAGGPRESRELRATLSSSRSGKGSVVASIGSWVVMSLSLLIPRRAYSGPRSRRHHNSRGSPAPSPRPSSHRAGWCQRRRCVPRASGGVGPGRPPTSTWPTPTGPQAGAPDHTTSVDGATAVELNPTAAGQEALADELGCDYNVDDLAAWAVGRTFEEPVVVVNDGVGGCEAGSCNGRPTSARSSRSPGQRRLNASTSRAFRQQGDVATCRAQSAGGGPPRRRRPGSGRRHRSRVDRWEGRWDGREVGREDASCRPEVAGVPDVVRRVAQVHHV